MFEDMGGREGLIRFLDTSLESGLPSAEVWIVFKIIYESCFRNYHSATCVFAW